MIPMSPETVTPRDAARNGYFACASRNVSEAKFVNMVTSWPSDSSCSKIATLRS